MFNAKEHPIDPAVRRDIETRLLAIEAEHGVRILYACESGSRAWGFASSDSDYDVRFIYAHPLSWYLQVTAQRNVIELPISGDLDINGWELRKALGLLKKGNATLVEWLDSPVVYRADPVFLSAMRQVAEQTHQAPRSFHHYVHMARKNYREHLCDETVHLKKYLYTLRPLLAVLWIEQDRGAAPMRFSELLKATVTDPALRTAIDELLKVKRATKEAGYGAPLPLINAFIASELTRLEGVLPPEPKGIDFAPLDRLLMEAVQHCSRVGNSIA